MYALCIDKPQAHMHTWLNSLSYNEQFVQPLYKGWIQSLFQDIPG